MFAGAGNDVVFGGSGNDRLFGEDGDDTIVGEDGDDLISARLAGARYLRWAATMPWAAGNDVLLAGTGNDIVHGDARR